MPWLDNAEREGKGQGIIEMAEFLSEQVKILEEYDEQLLRRFIEKVAVLKRNLQ